MAGKRQVMSAASNYLLGLSVLVEDERVKREIRSIAEMLADALYDDKAE